MIDIVRIGLSIYLLFGAFSIIDDFVVFRWVMFLGAGYLLYVLIFREVIVKKLKVFYLVFFIVVIYLFNPISPVYLYNFGLWRLIDFVVAVLLIIKPIINNTILSRENENDLLKKLDSLSEIEKRKYLNDTLKYDPLLGEANEFKTPTLEELGFGSSEINDKKQSESSSEKL